MLRFSILIFDQSSKLNAPDGVTRLPLRCKFVR